MIRKVHFGLHEMRELSADDRKYMKMGLSHVSQRLPKLVVVTRSGVQMDNGIVNVQQSKAVIFHEYQGSKLWKEFIMEEDCFRRRYRFITKQIVTYVEKREEATLQGVVVKKTKSGRRTCSTAS